ncbi:MAG: hypothetical protein HYY84_19000 [Deltaproteobacteria bacterium]|nr:hypothetical protein [Deltaproteobacteria bacterium]
MRKNVTRIIVTSAFSFTIACGPDEGALGGFPEIPETETASAKLSGFAVTEGCTYDETKKLEPIVAWAKKRIASPAFASCLAEGIISPAYGHTAESIQSTLLNGAVTKVVCGSYGGAKYGLAKLGPGEERVPLDKSILASWSNESVAGAIAFEIARTKGWNHLPGLTWYTSIPAVVMNCTRFGTPRGDYVLGQPGAFLEGSKMSFETELARAGGLGGGPFEMSCPNGAFIQGVDVGTTNVVNWMQARCATYSKVTGKAGVAALTNQVGGSQGSSFGKTLACANDKVAVGVVGRSGALVDQVALKCVSYLAVLNDKPWATATTESAGGMGGGGFERTCPHGMALKRVFGRAGASIDQVRVVCQDLKAPEKGAYVRGYAYNGWKAGATGYLDERVCSGYGAMVGIYGHAKKWVERLGGICRGMASATAAVPSFDASKTHVTPSSGLLGADGQWLAPLGPSFCAGPTGSCLGWEVTSSGYGCQAGQAMVGFGGKVEKLAIDRIYGVCADAAMWKNAAIQTPYTVNTQTFSSGEGNGDGIKIPFETRCARGEFLVGLRTWKGDKKSVGPISGVASICRKL